MDKRLSSFLNTLFSVMLGFALWSLVLAISNSNTKPLDITKGGRFTLALQSKQAVASLAQPVKLYAFVGEKEKPKTEEVLKRYQSVDEKKFTFQIVDPRKNPTLAKKYQIRFAGEGVIEFVDEKSKSGSGRTERMTTIGEQEITTALLKLQRNQSFKAYFLSGHGEKDPNGSDEKGCSQLKADLAKEGFTVESLNLVSSLQIPKDATLLVCAGPTKALLPGEEKVLREYLQNYGRMLMMFEPETPEGYAKLMGEFGVQVSDEIVLDQFSSRLQAEPVFSIGLTYDQNHAVSKDLKTNTMFELARQVKLTTPAPSGVVGSVLVSTKDSPATAILVKTADLFSKDGIKLPANPQPTMANLVCSVARREVDPAKPATPSPTPKPGEEKPKETKEGRIVVMGDSDAIGNMLYVVNKDLALNSFNWLAANETSISIRPKDPQTTPLMMPGGEMSRLMFMVSFLLPGLVAGLGIFLVMRRQ